MNFHWTPILIEVENRRWSSNDIDEKRSVNHLRWRIANIIQNKWLTFTIDNRGCINQSIIGFREDIGMLSTGCLNHSCHITSNSKLAFNGDEEWGDVGCDKMPTIWRIITRGRTFPFLHITMANVSVSRINRSDASTRIQSAHDLTIATCISITNFTCASNFIGLGFMRTQGISITATVFHSATV